MWRTANAGTTWQPLPAFDGLQVRTIAIFRGNPRLMAAGTNTGVFETDDGGLTWRRISPADNQELQPVVSLAFDSKDGNVLYAGTPHLPWKTGDGGSSWSSVHEGMLDDSDVFSVLVDRNRPQRVFAAACSGIYRSLNAGAKWAQLPSSREASSRTYALAQDPLYENVLFAGTTHGMIRSLDSGASWERISPYATRSIAFDWSRPGRIFIATDQAGILRSDDNGRTWRPANRGICNRRLGPLTIDDTGTLYTSGSLDGTESAFFVLPKGAEKWSAGRVPAKPLLVVAPSPGNPGALYAATPRAVLRSSDGGKRWRTVASVDGESPLTGMVTASWDGDAVLVAAGSKVFVSRDSGSTWLERQFPAPIRALVALDPRSIAAIVGSEIFVSSDGYAWEPNGPVGGDVEIHGLVTSGARFFVATTTGLRAPGQPSSWPLVPGLPAGNTVQAICRHSSRAATLFAASYNSIFTSADGGRSWRKMQTGDWPVDSVKQLMVDPADADRLLVLTPQQGVFALQLDPEGDGKIAIPDQRSANER
jgi:photosystem II stability/assembly factor-like uncharacterized protein